MEEDSYLPVDETYFGDEYDDDVESTATPVDDRGETNHTEVEDEESHSGAIEDDDISAKSATNEVEEKAPTGKRKASIDSIPNSSQTPSKKARAPSVAGLTIPFRTVKKAMKLDPDTPIVQNEAAIMTTVAVELFVKELAKSSFDLAKSRGRTTVRYEDVAEARANEKAYSFLEPLLP